MKVCLSEVFETSWPNISTKSECYTKQFRPFSFSFCKMKCKKFRNFFFTQVISFSNCRPQKAVRSTALLPTSSQGRSSGGQVSPAQRQASTKGVLGSERPQDRSRPGQKLSCDRRGSPDRRRRQADRFGQLLLRGREHCQHEDQRLCSHHCLR